MVKLGAKCASHESSVSDCQELSALTGAVSEILKHHVLPLGALGTRRASVAHILHSIMFRLRLECFSWQDVSRFVQQTFSLTADQGTESKIGDVQSLSLSENFPWWCEVSNQQLQEDPLIDVAVHEELCLPETQDPQEPLQALPGFSKSVRIPPHFHIIDKVSNSLLSSLKLSWPRIEKGFKSIVVFFHAGHTRRHFVKLCVPIDVQFLFSSGPPAWDGGRVWGVLQKIVHWLLKREGAIKRNFDAQKLLSKRQDQMREGNHGDAADAPDQSGEGTKRDFYEDRDGSNTAACDSAIKDSFFWAALHMMSHFAELLDHVQAWLLGCSCHPPAAREELEAVLGKSGLDIAEKCPMRGRRGPDLAAGQFRHIFNAAAHEQEDLLLMVHLASLPDTDRRDIMLDFEAGRSRLLTEVEIRLSVWDALPLKLFALAYHDEDAARETVLQCCMQFEELTAAEQDTSVHELTRKLLSHTGSGSLRSDVVRWLQGHEMSSCLEAISSQMRFTPTLEISVERLHAFLKQRTLASHHISGAYASLQLRRPEIVNCHGQHFDELSECCALCSTPARIVEALDLQLFPDFLDFQYDGDAEGRGCRIKSSVPHGLVDSVLYRRNLCMQYQSLPDPKLAQRRARAEKSKHAGEENTAEDAIAYEHFRSTFRSDCFYSVKKSKSSRAEEGAGPAELTHEDLLNTFFVPLQKCLKESASKLDGETQKRLQLELTGDEAGLPLSLEDGSDLSFNFICANAGGPGEHFPAGGPNWFSCPATSSLAVQEHPSSAGR